MVCRPPRSEPQALRGTASLAFPLPSPHRGRWTLPVVLGPKPEDSLLRWHKAGWALQVPPLAKGVPATVWSIEPVGPVARGEARHRGPRQGRGSAGCPAPAASSCDRHLQGWLCLLVATVPVGGCVTSWRGSRQTVICGLKGPGGQPLWVASPAPEGYFFPRTASPSPQGAGQACFSPGDFHQRDYEAKIRPKGVSWGHRSGGKPHGCTSLLQRSGSHQAPHGFQTRGDLPWWGEPRLSLLGEGTWAPWKGVRDRGLGDMGGRC